MRSILLVIIMAGLIAPGMTAPALGAQFSIHLDPAANASPFQVIYQRTASIGYGVGDGVSQLLDGRMGILEVQAGPEHPEMQRLMDDLNRKILSDGSTARVSDLAAEYVFHLTGRDATASLDFNVVLTGSITNYVITQDQQKTLIDLGWRGLSSAESIVLDDVDINIPLNMLRVNEPLIYDLVHDDAEAAEILSMPLINADFILQQPMTNWHFLFDPTGINVDAGTFGMSQELAGRVISSWTMGESGFREGIQVETEWDATITGDSHPAIAGPVDYELRAVQSADSANIHVTGFGTLGVLDGVEIAGVTPDAPKNFGTTSTGDFPVTIIYGMAGLATVGGGLFFMFSNRALKNEKQGQQGIDPSRLVGYQTSAASGGYRTNRGEAQLRDDSSYPQTRSYYDQADTRTDTRRSPV